MYIIDLAQDGDSIVINRFQDGHHHHSAFRYCFTTTVLFLCAGYLVTLMMMLSVFFAKISPSLYPTLKLTNPHIPYSHEATQAHCHHGEKKTIKKKEEKLIITKIELKMCADEKRKKKIHFANM